MEMITPMIRLDKPTAVIIVKNTIRHLKEELARNDVLLKQLKRIKTKTIKTESGISMGERYSKDLRSMLRDVESELYVLKTIKQKGE